MLTSRLCIQLPPAQIRAVKMAKPVNCVRLCESTVLRRLSIWMWDRVYIYALMLHFCVFARNSFKNKEGNLVFILEFDCENNLVSLTLLSQHFLLIWFYCIVERVICHHRSASVSWWQTLKSGKDTISTHRLHFCSNKLKIV